MIAWLKQKWPAWMAYWAERGVVPRWQFLLVYLLIVTVGILGFSKSQEQSDQTNRLANSTNGALCALRHDLEDRVASGERFLRDHPQGLAGIPARTIRTSLDGQRRTVLALSALRCP